MVSFVFRSLKIKKEGEEMDKKIFNDWHKYAQCYDVLNELYPYQNLQKTIIRNLNLRSEDLILDAGCGTGNLEWWALKLFGDIRIFKFIAIDYCLEMLLKAKRKLEGCNVYFLQADLNNRLPFKSNLFSKIVCVNTLYAVCSPPNTIREFYRVLKQNGKLIIVNPRPGYENGLILKEHCGDTGPDEPWLGAHTSLKRDEEIIKRSINDRSVASLLMNLAYFNKKILKNGKFWFLSSKELTKIVNKSKFLVIKEDKVYANQNIIIICKKEATKC